MLRGLLRGLMRGVGNSPGPGARVLRLEDNGPTARKQMFTNRSAEISPALRAQMHLGGDVVRDKLAPPMRRATVGAPGYRMIGTLAR
jgi:hypothetical protein